MSGLLDFIFENIEIEKLDRIQVLNHTSYISEISQQSLPLDKKIKFLSVKVRLQQRLMELDQKRNQHNGQVLENLRYRLKL
jgi:hypothetical protein